MLPLLMLPLLTPILVASTEVTKALFDRRRTCSGRESDSSRFSILFF